MNHEPRFRDPTHGGEELAKALAPFKGGSTVVYGLPRGGVVTALAVAQALGAPLDVLIVRKLTHPMNSELAIGAITDAGEEILHPTLAEAVGEAWLAEERERQLHLARERRRRYAGFAPHLSCKDKVAIVVDDGIATGSTMRAALLAVRDRGPLRVIVAAPVAPPEVFERFRDYADEVVVPHTPDGFYAICQFYEDFTPVEDEEIVECLRRGSQIKRAVPSGAPT